MGKCDNFFGMVLPSSSLLILDFIHAANTIIDSANTGVGFIFREEFFFHLLLVVLVFDEAIQRRKS